VRSPLWVMFGYGALGMRMSDQPRGVAVAIILIALLVVLIIGGLGFVIHVLWWVALIALILWLLGFLLRAGESASSRRHWYRW